MSGATKASRWLGFHAPRHPPPEWGRVPCPWLIGPCLRKRQQECVRILILQAAPLLQLGCTPHQLADAGYSHIDLERAGCSAMDLVGVVTPADVVISYDRADVQIMRKLLHVLQESGVKVWAGACVCRVCRAWLGPVSEDRLRRLSFGRRGPSSSPQGAPVCTLTPHSGTFCRLPNR